MDLTPLVRAAEVLMSPLAWGSRDAWLGASLRTVRQVRGVGGEPLRPAAIDELQELLRLPGDQPEWLRAMLEPSDAARGVRALPSLGMGSDLLLPVVSLRCALAAGIAALDRLREWRTTLGQAFDDVDTGMAIFESGDLREIARNARWGELLHSEPERERLVEHIAQLAGQAAAQGREVREVDWGLELAGGSYRLVASRASAGSLLTESAVLVLVDRVSPGLPTTQELRVSFGLRGREPQVALLAAEGLSNADIAERLRLSAHTVRHYLERVLDRLGLHTRKALALRLMAASGERPQPSPTGPSRRNGEKF